MFFFMYSEKRNYYHSGIYWVCILYWELHEVTWEMKKKKRNKKHCSCQLWVYCIVAIDYRKTAVVWRLEIIIIMLKTINYNNHNTNSDLYCTPEFIRTSSHLPPQSYVNCYFFHLSGEEIGSSCLEVAKCLRSILINSYLYSRANMRENA